VADPRCERQDEVLASRHTSDAGLHAHVASCPDCAELVSLADAILDERNAAVRETSVPGSGAAWWRIQLRAHREAERTAVRTVTLVQAVSIAAALAVLGVPSLAWFAKSGLPPWSTILQSGMPLPDRGCALVGACTGCRLVGRYRGVDGSRRRDMRFPRTSPP
jgi:hypothetical protein